MSFLDWLWDLFRAPKKVPILPTPDIKGIEVGQLLKQYSNNLWISDGLFKLVNTENMKEFLMANPVNGRKYITESHDCDDYSFELMGDVSDWNPALAFGIVWGNRAGDGAPHAWNFYIDETKKVRYVEPQTDSIFDPSTESVWIMII